MQLIQIKSRLTAGPSDTGGSDFGLQWNLYAVPSSGCLRSSIQEAAPCTSFLAFASCYFLFTLFSQKQPSSPPQSRSTSLVPTLLPTPLRVSASPARVSLPNGIFTSDAPLAFGCVFEAEPRRETHHVTLASTLV